jgi:hemerythrin
MNPVEWSEKLANGLPAMDKTHQEFIAHYNRLVSAFQKGDTAFLLATMDVFIEHTVAHFEQENRWMQAVQFPACHKAEHDRVLAVMVDVRKNLEEGDAFLTRRLLDELFPWFENHANTMDAALAFYLDQVGYDVETNTLRPRPEDMPASASLGAAGSPCTHVPS